ncbi:unnamed protein product [Clonostachys rosea]|uniref:Transcription factor domain-containing protein n=1 Tax=Bionectria ochroleuca TaxID=29856 RepID=A0ABY6V4P4_BIOOC|nr:unnamed protein product [Clonostachys rosea]
MLRLFDNLARSGNMVRFSFTDFQACSIATTITLLAGVLERDATYESRVEFAMNCLHKMLEQGASSLSISVSDSPFGGSSSEKTGYKEWGEWLSKSVHASVNAEAHSTDDHISTADAAGSPHLEPWVQRPPNSNWGDEWNYDQAQRMSLSMNLGQTYQGGMPDLANSSLDDDFFSPYHNEQTFLLGLTGLDVLDLQ